MCFLLYVFVIHKRIKGKIFLARKGILQSDNVMLSVFFTIV